MHRLALCILLTIAGCLHTAAEPVCHITRYDENNGIAQWHVTNILQDRNGIIWLSTWNGLDRFDGYEFRCFKSQAGDDCTMPSDRFRDIWLCPDGNIGCRVDEQIFKFNLSTYRFSNMDNAGKYRHSSRMLRTGEYFIHTDTHGTEWRIGHDGTISYREQGHDSFTDYPTDVALGEIRVCLADRQDNLWLPGRHSVYKLSFAKSPTTPFPLDKPAQVRGLMTDSRQRYWVTTKEDATVRLYSADNSPIGYLAADGSLHKRYTSFGKPVYCLGQSRDGTVYLGSKPGGLFRLTEKPDGNFTIKHIEGLNCENVYDIKEDHAGRLWIATLGGGINCVVNPGSENPTVLTPGKGLGKYPRASCLKVRNLHITADGTLLAATTEGLVVAKIPRNDIKDMVFHRHIRETGRATSLSSNATMDISEDARHRIFISTESGGVNMITSKRLTGGRLDFRHYNTFTGMPTDVTVSTMPSGEWLWIVGSNMIIKLNPDNGSHSAFSNRFLLTASHFSDIKPLILPDGRWLFGLHDGAVTLHPDSLRKSTYVPPITLTGISVENAPVVPASFATDTITLQPGERNMAVHFAALDYRDAANIEYAFRLIADNGNDGKWNDIRHNRSVTLLDLKPGTYSLQLRSTNADGVWTDNTRTITIIVIPHFRETAWAKLLAVLALMLVTGAVIATIIYIRHIKKQQRNTLEAYLALLNKEADKDRQPVQKATMGSYDDEILKRITAFVEQHISDADINIGDMAAAAAISRSGLQRRMKQAMGVTPLEFLREARIKYACRLLTETDKTVSEVAFCCGFSDPKYFSRCFKASTGMSPSEYKTKQTDRSQEA